MAKDPYRYFRIEARELVSSLEAGILELEKGEPDDERDRALLRYAHTLKGAARVVRLARIGDLAHALEDALGERRPARELLATVDAIRAELARIDAPPAAPTSAPEPATADVATLRTDIAELDAISRSLEAAAQAAAALRQSLEGGAAHWEGSLDRLQLELDEARASLADLRLVPAESAFEGLERAVRDAADETGRAVTLSTATAAVRVDARVLRAVRQALVHVVGNAVAHGIEPASARHAAGKPATGSVALAVERRGDRVAFVCRDDGAGVDVEAVRRKLVDAGLVAARDAAALSEDQILERLGTGGLTTRAAVSQVAGRGLGLEAARRFLAELGGELRLGSTAGRGTTVEMIVPVSLAAMPVLAVRASDVSAYIPLAAVRSSQRVARGDLIESGQGPALRVGDRTVPVAWLGDMLGRGAAFDAPACNVVVVEEGDRAAAVVVDQLAGVRTAVVQGLPPAAAVAPVVTGACADVAGPPHLVLSPRLLVDLARAPGTGRTVRPPARAPEPILVIDDSLTTRMLEQSILETAGHRVELAASAEEGLAMARERRYSLFLVDVEMPGMNGFEFLQVVAADPRLREVPAIIVTSRAHPEDIARGKELGAHAYIVKGSFDQGMLLEAVARLVGEGER